MKKTLLFLAALLLAAAVLVPTPAKASHDDFDITYTVYPELVAYKGAEVNIGIRVQNKGTTPITGFRVAVTTVSGYSQTWTGTINPGTTRPTVNFLVPFIEADLGVDKLLTVSIENDGDGDYRDGTHVRTFSVAGTHDIFYSTFEKSPNRTTFEPGERITVDYDFHNAITTHAATNVVVETYISRGGSSGDRQTTNHGTVLPEQTISGSHSMDFTAGSVGSYQAGYQLTYDMMGHSYVEIGWPIEFVVQAPVFDFDVHLHASPTTIDAGDEVTFTVDVTDTGETTLTGIELRNAEGGLMDVLPPIGIGDTRSFVTTAHIYETTDVSYVVICRDDYGNSDSKETNSVRITVREPEVSPTPSPTPSPTSEPTPTAAEFEGVVATMPPVMPSNIIAATPTHEVQAISETQPPDEDAITLQPKQDNTVLYIVIALLGAVIIAGAIAIPLLLRKNKAK